MNRRTGLQFAVLALLCCSHAVIAETSLKIYILSGQSNMQGHGHRSTLSYMAEDPETSPLLDKILYPDGSPRVYQDVPIIYYTDPGRHGNPNLPKKKAGPLSIGYGGVGGDDKIGPELGFGITMHEKLQEPILIIKTAWGGKSLNTDFRPPSAGPYELSQHVKDLWAKNPQGAHGVPREEDRDAWWEKKNEETGHFFRLMVDCVKETLADIKAVYPAYDAKHGYEIAGFVWFQGWNDMCDGQTYPESNTPGGYSEYSRLMACFIRDVRKEFDAPEMPFVIGVIGVDGDKATGGIANLRPAMAAPATMDEFKATVAAVQTGEFWDHAMAGLMSKKTQVDHRLNAGHVIAANGRMEPYEEDFRVWQPVGTPAPEDRVWHYTPIAPSDAKDMLAIKEKKRYREITLPPELRQWQTPDFDDGTWQRGKAPIGLGIWKQGGFPQVTFNSDWGNGEFLLMRTTFEVKDLDYVKYRICVLSRQGFSIYLNGEKIHTYVWWQDTPFYRAIELDDKYAKLLKKGTNVLAVYANVEYARTTEEPFNAIDVIIEGISEAGQEYVSSQEYRLKQMDKVCTREEGKIILGASNAGYHYLGSGKMLAQIGQAFAEAMLQMQKGQ